MWEGGVKRGPRPCGLDWAWLVEKGRAEGGETGTCAGLRVAIPGLAVRSLALGVARSGTRAAAPTYLDASVTGGRAGGPRSPRTPGAWHCQEEPSASRWARAKVWARGGAQAAGLCRVQDLDRSSRCVPTPGRPKHPFRRGPPYRSQAGAEEKLRDNRSALVPVPPMPQVFRTCPRGHSSPLLLIPSRCPGHSRDRGGHTWAHRGAAGLLLGGLSWAGRVLGAGAEPGTTAPTRASSHGEAALGAGGPGCPGGPAQQLWRGKGQVFHTGVLAGLGGLGGWVGSEKPGGRTRGDGECLSGLRRGLCPSRNPSPGPWSHSQRTASCLAKLQLRPPLSVGTAAPHVPYHPHILPQINLSRVF